MARALKLCEMALYSTVRRFSNTSDKLFAGISTSSRITNPFSRAPPINILYIAHAPARSRALSDASNASLEGAVWRPSRM